MLQLVTVNTLHFLSKIYVWKQKECGFYEVPFLCVCVRVSVFHFYS